MTYPSKLMHAQYVTQIDASLEYSSLMLNEDSSYLCQFARYRYTKLLFGSAVAGDMFQRKIDKIFIELPKVIGIAGDILIVEYDCYRHDRKLCQVPLKCRKENLRLSKNKCHFRCTSVPVFGEIISRAGVQPDAHKLCTFTEMSLPKLKKEV